MLCSASPRPACKRQLFADWPHGTHLHWSHTRLAGPRCAPPPPAVDMVAGYIDSDGEDIPSQDVKKPEVDCSQAR